MEAEGISGEGSADDAVAVAAAGNAGYAVTVAHNTFIGLSIFVDDAFLVVNAGLGGESYITVAAVGRASSRRGSCRRASSGCMDAMEATVNADDNADVGVDPTPGGDPGDVAVSFCHRFLPLVVAAVDAAVDAAAAAAADADAERDPAEGDQQKHFVEGAGSSGRRSSRRALFPEPCQ